MAASTGMQCATHALCQTAHDGAYQLVPVTCPLFPIWHPHLRSLPDGAPPQRRRGACELPRPNLLPTAEMLHTRADRGLRSGPCTASAVLQTPRPLPGHRQRGGELVALGALWRARVCAAPTVCKSPVAHLGSVRSARAAPGPGHLHLSAEGALHFPAFFGPRRSAPQPPNCYHTPKPCLPRTPGAPALPHQSRAACVPRVGPLGMGCAASRTVKARFQPAMQGNAQPPVMTRVATSRAEGAGFFFPTRTPPPQPTMRRCSTPRRHGRGRPSPPVASRSPRKLTALPGLSQTPAPRPKAGESSAPQTQTNPAPAASAQKAAAAAAATPRSGTATMAAAPPRGLRPTSAPL